ncbi:hypothetical protein CI109_100052 [Kwoniella shandongensis]|uniref:Amine oxidase n=1 Tax=Kwoniella shandongensis TaxID=1734106 RepID=A0AAJ8LDU9_9TREE
MVQAQTSSVHPAEAALKGLKISGSPANAHPLDPLSATEIRLAVDAVRAFLATNKYAGKPVEKPLFNSISLREPPKYSVLRWSGLFSAKDFEEAGADANAPVKRQADIHLICPITSQSFEAIVDLPSNLPEYKKTDAVVSVWTPLHELIQPSLQTEELIWAEEICQRDPKVKEACDAIGIKQEDIAVDGWCIGIDERFPGRRLQQCFVFARLRPNDNLYAHPCDFIPVIDSHTGEVLTIDYPPKNNEPGEPHAPSSADAYDAQPKRERFAPPMAGQNYLPEQIVMDEPDFKVRDTLKPLHVVQPEGVSYKLEGRVLTWQNWKIHIGFEFREGLVLSNITYDDGAKGTRPVFYRLSVAEMVVPYAKTIFPHHRKQAFDTGEYGVGALANSLELGCDCLGSITYLDADFVTRSGGIQTIKSAICIHEEDAGILHKHTDFRDNRAHVARNRKLVISSICTYGFYFNFALDGSVELEVKATGIVNAYCLAPGEKRDPTHEVEVAPRIAAQHHQHLFSLRVDPMIDGLKNQVVQVDSVPDDEEVGSDANFYGNGFKTVKTLFESSKESVSNYDAAKARTWAIENPSKQHFASGLNIGYKIVSKDMPPMLAKPGSIVWNRAPFARQNMFVTKYSDDEKFPSDVHINQNPGGPDFGSQQWIDRDDKIVNEDIVCWPCFGVTHISRPEDWPIMPVEILRVHLKPSGFFDRNPGLDVPSTADAKSRLANEAFANGNGHSTNGNGHGAAQNGSFRSYTSTTSSSSAPPEIQTWIKEITSRPREITHDLIDTERASQLQRILPTRQDDRVGTDKDEDLRDGEVLPKGHHLVYFRPKFRLKDLGRDGSSTDYNAPPPYTRRMWAGGSVSWSTTNHLRIGERATQAVSVPKIEYKKGMVFVHQKRVLWPGIVSVDGIENEEEDQGWAVKEMRTHVFRQADTRKGDDITKVSTNPQAIDSTLPSPSPLPTPASSTTPYTFTYTPTTPLLFLFSALTHNPHKVHYDHPWTISQEGHPAPLVHGPMTALLLIELASRAVTGGRGERGTSLDKFEYRATSPMVVDQEIGKSVTWTEDGKMELVAEQKGKVGMKAVASYV